MAGSPAPLASGVDRTTAATVVRACMSWNQKLKLANKITFGTVLILIGVGIFAACLHFSQPGTSCGGGNTTGPAGKSCTYTTSRGISVYGVTEEHGSRPWLLIIGIVLGVLFLALTVRVLRSGRYPTRDEALEFEQKVASWRAHIVAENPALLQNFDLEVADVRQHNRMTPPPIERQ